MAVDNVFSVTVMGKTFCFVACWRRSACFYLYAGKSRLRLALEDGVRLLVVARRFSDLVTFAAKRVCCPHQRRSAFGVPGICEHCCGGGFVLAWSASYCCRARWQLYS